jgi:chemotaxis protein MotB
MRRRRQPEEASDHRDRWLISYSDFMTLLFALFVVLFATSYRDNQMIKRLSVAIQVGFQQLGASSGGAKNSGVAYPNLVPDTTIGTPSDRLENQSKDNAGSLAVDVVALRKQLESVIGPELRNKEMEMRITPEGFVISLRELGFFNSGQAVLLPGAGEKIEKIGRILSQRGLELRIEGHSDDQPIHTAQFRSNWELSTARAMAVLLLLVDDAGFDPKKISVVGYGQYRPIADNATPDGRKVNRRVDLVVVGTAVPPTQSAAGK